jgi:hypothetical protein
MTRKDLKQLIRESVNEVINEIGAVDYNDYEPMDSNDSNDFGDWLEDLKESLRIHLEKVENDQDPNDEHYRAMFDIDNKISDFMRNNKVPQSEKNIINKDTELEGLLGQVHEYRGSHSGEKTYVNETWEEAISSGDLEEAIMTEKAPPGMEPWVQANKEHFVTKYGSKKGLGVVYGTAWKKFYNNQNK